jgi:hypothetical protein
LVAGDTTEEEVHQEQNDCYSRQEWGTTLGSIEEDARPDRDTGPNFGKARETPGQVDGNCNVIAPSNASQSECPVSPGIKFCALPAYDHQTGHPNEVSRTVSGENYTANIVLI